MQLAKFPFSLEASNSKKIGFLFDCARSVFIRKAKISQITKVLGRNRYKAKSTGQVERHEAISLFRQLINDYKIIIHKRYLCVFVCPVYTKQSVEVAELASFVITFSVS